MKKLLWAPSQTYRTNSQIYAFMQHINEKYGLSLDGYKPLYDWSVTCPEIFWGELWAWFDVIASKPYSKVVDDIRKFPGAQWFVDAEMNYAENILRYSDKPGMGILFRGESNVRRTLSRAEVYDQVTRLATALRSEGVKPGDVVAGYLPNLPETVIAMLATTAIGAVWCSCATDIGPVAAEGRIGQVKPVVLITADGYYYKGKRFDVVSKAAELAAMLPTVRKVVFAHYAGSDTPICTCPNAVMWDTYLPPHVENFQFEQVSASAPAVIMFSSGTTGKPKCMVQSVGGLLINQLKELALHHDLRLDEKMLYITSCSWMMWNWQAAGLGVGATLVLYDGNPSYPDTGAIWRILDEEQVEVFGLSATYIHSLMEEGFAPKNVVDLSRLRCISQTGSALSPEGFDYLYTQIKPDFQFNSIAGGTDINGCFAIGNPLSPVYANELTAPGLGMKIECYDENAKPIRDTQGELVCECPTPSMPLFFWDDADGSRYFDAYFDVYPGVWRHGDYVLFDSETGGVSFFGRSDSLLKPSGVRIGTVEIYNQVAKIPQVSDSLAIGQQWKGDQRVILFVVPVEGAVIDEQVKQDIRTILKVNASPRHVPAVILQAPDIPRTLNGKKVESAVTNIVNGRKVTNRDALQNPESLDWYEQILPTLQK